MILAKTIKRSESYSKKNACQNEKNPRSLKKDTKLTTEELNDFRDVLD